MSILKIIKNNINLFIVFVLFTIINLLSFTFGADLRSSLHYGIKNIAKVNKLIPITVTIENKDSDIFKGKLLVDHYENNESIYQYEFDIDINEERVIHKTFDVFITNRINTFYIKVIDDKGESYLNERINIDLSSSDNKIITGIISDNDNLVDLLNDIYINDYTISTKTIKITDDDYIENRDLLNMIDLLILSNCDSDKISEGLNNAINNYYLSGNPIILAIGEKGDNAIPTCFKKLISRPSFTQDYILDLNEYIDNNERLINNISQVRIYNYDFYNNISLYKKNDVNLISIIRNNNVNLINLSFDLNSIAGFSTFNTIANRIIELSFSGSNDINNNQPQLQNNNNYNYNYLKNIVDEIDNSKIPNLVYIAIILITYLLVLTLVLFGLLRNMSKTKYYIYFSAVVSFVFIIIMHYMSLSTRRENSFLSYVSIVEVNDYSSNETSLLNFKTSDNNSYSFETNANNLIYPINRINNEPILSLDFINQNNIKLTRIHKDKNMINIEVMNANDFDSNIFIYENRNYISDKYDISLNINLYDGKISGKVQNKMNVDIKDASIYSFGKVVYIGDIKAGSTNTINANRVFNAPIGNNTMCSELMCYYPNTKIIEYYLINNIKQYFDDVYLFGFIDNSLTMDIKSDSVKDKYGKTLIIKRTSLNNKSDSNIDLCVFSNIVSNLKGNYNDDNNSISGEEEVVNEYEISDFIKLNKIYFENLSNYDIGKLNYNVPFYGDIYIYNFKANRYEIVNNYQINNYFDEYIYNNKIRISYVPNARDILYRNLSLPIIRYIGEKR